MSNDHENNAGGHDKSLTIIVNAQEKVVMTKELTFTEVVALAFGDVPANENTIYTVTYRRGGNEHKPEGILVEGESVKIKDGMIFNVTATIKS